MNQSRSLRDTLTDQAEARSLSVVELAKRSGAPEKYVEALLAGDIQALPALPYLRIHLVKIAEVLGIPASGIIDQFKIEYEKMHSGAGDMLPGNRFALPNRRKYYIIVSVACLVVLSIIGTLRSGFFGSPQLTITNPPEATQVLRTTEATVILTGRITPGDTLTVNGAHVPVLGDGSFSNEYRLVPELNTLEFVARRFLGRMRTERRQVYYDVATTTPGVSTTTLELAPDADSLVQ